MVLALSLSYLDQANVHHFNTQEDRLDSFGVQKLRVTMSERGSWGNEGEHTQGQKSGMMKRMSVRLPGTSTVPPPPPRLPNNSSLSKTRAVYLLIIVKHHQVANAPLSSDHYPHIYDNLLCREDGAWRWPPGEQFFPDRFCATTGDRINFTVHNLAPQNRQAVDDLL